MLIRPPLFIAWVLAAGLTSIACAKPAPTSTESEQASASPTTQPKQVVVESPGASVDEPEEGRRAPDLEWDTHVGWELPVTFPPGELTTERDPKSYLSLNHLMVEDGVLLRRLLGAPPGLHDRSLILPHDQLCQPQLSAAIAELAPPRLLLRIEGDPTASEWDCLARLPPVDLYLTGCPNDGLPTLFNCDGDAQLDALLRRPELLARVRALGISFGEARHWTSLSHFPRLNMLKVHGPAVTLGPDPDQALAICSLPDLAYVDFSDAAELGHSAELPLDCVFGLETYHNKGLTRWPTAPEGECRLRRVELFSISDEERALLARCPEVEVETSEEAYERYLREREGQGD